MSDYEGDKAQVIQALERIISRRVNDALEQAAKAVYDSKHIWDLADRILYDAAERVRSFKVHE